MSQAIAKKQSKPTSSARKSPKENNIEDTLPVAVTELNEDLKETINHINTEEIANNKACEDITCKIVDGLQTKLAQANIDEKEANKLIEDIKAERERLFQLNADIRQTNDMRLKLFLEYIFKAVKLVGGLAALKIILDFIKALITSSTKK